MIMPLGLLWTIASESCVAFEAVERLDDNEQNIIRELLEGMIVKYEARRWTNTQTAS